MSSNYHYLVSIFLKIREFIVEYFVYKRLFGFESFSMKVFLFQSKTKNTVKDINYTSNKMNKKIQKYFCINTCLIAFNTLIDFFRKFYGVSQSKKLSPGSNCFLLTILSGSTIYVLMKHSDMVFGILKQMLSFLKKLHSLLFWDGLNKLSQPHETPL